MDGYHLSGDHQLRDSYQAALGRCARPKFFNREWNRVWDTKASLEQRAITLITASGVLVMLAFGFTAAVAKGTHFANFTPDERIVLVISLALFTLSALIALIVNQPKSYPDPDFRDILGISPDPIVGTPLQRFDTALEAANTLNDKKSPAIDLCV